ncbi:MAG: pyridoxamine 5'-phosphate oxidase family protein [Dehalococcoidia bacterium]
MNESQGTQRANFEMQAEARPEDAERVRAEVKEFIRTTWPGFLVTLRKDGRPHGRPVDTFVEGWTVGTISQGEHLKNAHIRNNPQVAYLWMESPPTRGGRLRCVWLQGVCQVVDDPEELAAFYRRREAATGVGARHADEEWTRLLLVTTPSLVRAEGFLGPQKPAIYRDFSR